MEIELNKLSKIGIDRVVLSNFKIRNWDKLDKKEIIDKLIYTQKLNFKDENYDFSYCNNLKDTGEEYDISYLEFNPIKLMTGLNIYNANMEDFKKCILYIEDSFKKSGIELDLSEAKIKEIELNITLPIVYSDLSEVITLFGKANKKRGLGLYTIDPDETSIHKMQKTGTFYINPKRKTGKVIKIYNKTLELNNKSEVYISQPLTRLEVLLGRDYFREVMERIGLDNTLSKFISLTNENLSKIFQEAIEQELIANVEITLEKLEKKLIRAFFNFRKNENSKRKERIKILNNGKTIPDYLKEDRGAFRYLEKNFWIFDVSFLSKICTLIESKNRNAYIIQLKNYSNINNLEKYKDFINRIFI